MLLMQQEREREMKAKQAELVRAFQMECDRRKQKEEADRIAYEREQLEYVLNALFALSKYFLLGCNKFISLFSNFF